MENLMRISLVKVGYYNFKDAGRRWMGLSRSGQDLETEKPHLLTLITVQSGYGAHSLNMWPVM